MNRINSLSIVYPAYNEEENIEQVILDAVNFCKKYCNFFEVVIVNDGSKDKTAEIVSRLQKENPKYCINLINHEKNKGYGATVNDGLKSAQGEWVFFTDADRQFELEDLAKFIPYTDQADFIVGRRVNRKDPLIRKLNASVFNIAGKIFYGTPIKDVDCAFKLMRKSILKNINLTTGGAMINTELMYKARRLGAKIVEIDVNHFERKFGSPTGGNPKVIFRAMKEFWKLRYQLFRTETNFELLNSVIVALITLLVAIVATDWSYIHHAILSFGDAEAHINIAKRITGSLTPGFAQIGGVWLPLQHILMMPFVLNDFLWRTGLGGSIISVLAFVWSSVIIYKLSFYITKNHWASFIGSLVFITNLNALYLSTTPMDEILMFSTAASSLYYFIKWTHEQQKLLLLILAAFFAFLASLARYDGWALVGMELFLVFFVTYIKDRNFKKAESFGIVYGLLGILGIALWLVWNKLIFGNFLYFADSSYGSKAQQMWFYTRGMLPTYNNLGLSALYYLTDTWLVAGTLNVILAILGVVLYIIDLFRSKNILNRSIIIVLFFPIAFYTTALFLGHASLILPTFAQSWYPWKLSNVRYGIQMLLAISFFIAYLASKLRFKWILIILAGLIIFQSYNFFTTKNVISFQDATVGLSSLDVSKGPDAIPAEQWISKHYDEGLVLMDDYRSPIGPIESGVPMNELIGIGNKPYWEASLENPTKYAKWVILQKASTDAVWTGLKNRQILEDYFDVVYRSGNIWIYKAKSNNENFVYKSGQNLMFKGETYNIYGANVYDLISLSRDSMDSIFNTASENNINTIRIWGFNKEGNLTDKDFQNLDYALYLAREYNIHLTIVFGNQWEDWGGKSNYTNSTNLDDFYTSSESKLEFEDYINSILNHANYLTGVDYKDDPYILSWELLNEPRLESDPTNDAVVNWTEDVGQYVLNIDSNHLLSTGTEGFISQSGSNLYYGQHGADFSKICGLPVIQICSVHLYPKYFNNTPSDTDIDSMISAWQSISLKYSKPLYIGEFGFDLSSDYKPISKKDKSAFDYRYQFYNSVFNTSQRKGIAGTYFWDLNIQSDKSYSISTVSNDDNKLLELIRKYYSKP